MKLPPVNIYNVDFVDFEKSENKNGGEPGKESD